MERERADILFVLKTNFLAVTSIVLSAEKNQILFAIRRTIQYANPTY